MNLLLLIYDRKFLKYNCNFSYYKVERSLTAAKEKSSLKNWMTSKISK